ncbi:hypothetical protein VHEMI07451 [[Torrubiella] hemipterigena]|uniref:Exo-polygalacturonase n=1 Tax=[Torrubiella] hemipterigena TaxID=1531966 RepID=A0A0A1TAG5_9HYPO|nr:hypothetical protein VHEMI07451 [[Torrubiella] hemipterigena]
MRSLSTLALALPLAAAVTSPLYNAQQEQDISSYPWLLPRDEPFVDHNLATRATDDAFWAKAASTAGRKVCIVRPDPKGGDDAPAIMDALNENCRSNSFVVFPGPTYNIKSNMTTTALDDVIIHHFGRFLWSTDIPYWLSVSMPIGFQNQSTAWYFGGNNVQFFGHGVGTLDGNGQVWYDWAKNQGNLHRRPMMINWRKLTNSVVSGVRFVQSQFWTMAITYSQHVELRDIYVNNTSASKWNTLNTDGCDTIWSDDITFRRWKVTQGDDSIALKGNSSNIRVLDSEFWGGQGLAIGSVGQYDGKYEYISNFYANNITMHHTAHAIYLKSWGGVSRGYPPNGGGGGIGVASNITVENINLEGTRESPFFIWQCENYEGHLGEDCQTSKFKFQNVKGNNIFGWTNDRVDQVAHLQCSKAAGGCNDVTLTNFNIKRGQNGKPSQNYHCENVHDAHGFKCTS